MWVFRLLYSPWILCQIPIVSRVRVLVMRDSYISLHSPGLRMLKRWGKRDLGVKEQEKHNEEDELLYFFHSKFVRVTAAFQAMSLFGLGRWGRPFTILAAHLSCVSYIFSFPFFGVFLMYSTRLVGIQRVRLVADTWCNDDAIFYTLNFIMDDGCWKLRAASFSEFKVEKP